VEMEVQRMVESARADLQARGMKLEKMPFDPSLFEAQAKRRVTLGLIVGEMIKQHELGAKPEQVRALVDTFAQTYEQPTEVVKWAYSDPQRLQDFEGQATESNVVAWVLGRATVEDKPIGLNELMGKAA
jgi:trigger factor